MFACVFVLFEGAVSVPFLTQLAVPLLCRRGRKRKDEEEQLAAIQAAAENGKGGVHLTHVFKFAQLFSLTLRRPALSAAQNPVQYVRLDPGGEWLCSGRVQQSERMLKNQLRDSKDVVAQVEAVRVSVCESVVGKACCAAACQSSERISFHYAGHRAAEVHRSKARASGAAA